MSKKPVQFSDLDRRRKEILLKTSNSLAVALELIAKEYGHNVARSIKIQATMTVCQLTDEEVNKSINSLDIAIQADKHTGDIAISQSMNVAWYR